MPDFIQNTISLLLPLVVFFVFAYYYIGGKQKNTIEQGKKAIFHEQCGGRFDLFNLTIPFVRHTMYDDFVVIAYGQKQYVLGYEELKGAFCKRHIFSKGITYLHRRKDLPSSIIIWSLSCSKVLDILQRKDVNIVP